MMEFDRFLTALKTEGDIQSYLDTLPYNPVAETKSPFQVYLRKNAHCMEGAIFAALALSKLGHKPRLIWMDAEDDDGHALAIFKKDGLWGSIAKSNTSLLRGRDPIYKTLRELIISYFEFYFNTKGVKSLRSYTAPLSLGKLSNGWETTEGDLSYVGDMFDGLKHYPVIPRRTKKVLTLASKDVMHACFFCSDEKGLYKPS
ncbi:MAG: hypothetical protein HGA85_00915 [Nanoarchaeota archaeon]|nr:hypothetical protein [Nanoarchaeota archaeon]